MELRVGRVIEIYSQTGRVKVTYEDTDTSSLELPMLTMNNECSLPDIGSRVVTLHFDNGSSKGIVLGTYYYDGNTPAAASGYRKDFGNGCYVTSDGDIDFTAGSTGISVKEIVQKFNELSKQIKSLAASVDELDTKTTALEEKVEKMDNSTKIEELEKKIAELEKKAGT